MRRVESCSGAVEVGRGPWRRIHRTVIHVCDGATAFEVIGGGWRVRWFGMFESRYRTEGDAVRALAEVLL